MPRRSRSMLVACATLCACLAVAPRAAAQDRPWLALSGGIGTSYASGTTEALWRAATLDVGHAARTFRLGATATLDFDGALRLYGGLGVAWEQDVFVLHVDQERGAGLFLRFEARALVTDRPEPIGAAGTVEIGLRVDGFFRLGIGGGAGYLDQSVLWQTHVRIGFDFGALIADPDRPTERGHRGNRLAGATAPTS